MAHEFIYTCYKLARFYPPDRTVLENISLSFYPGAKIGVIGSNGAGKSSLLRIMAGLDDGFTGDARLTPGFSVGYQSISSGVSISATTSRRSMGASVSVSNALSAFSAPGTAAASTTSTRFSMRMP